MKIIGYEEFCRMPAGTIFAPYEPCVFLDRLSIKVDPGREDPDGYHKYVFNGVMPLEPWIDDMTFLGMGDQEDASFEIYDGDNNDYCDYKMFMVFEDQDIDKMIKILEWAKGGCQEQIT